jgi:hypothetical protein
MAGVISDLKAHARILHRQVRQQEPLAMARTRHLAELHDHDPATLAALVRRRHCLAIIARELGFEGWPHAVAVLRGTESTDFGTLLYPNGSRGSLEHLERFVRRGQGPFEKNTAGTCSRIADTISSSTGTSLKRSVCLRMIRIGN